MHEGSENPHVGSASQVLTLYSCNEQVHNFVGKANLLKDSKLKPCAVLDYTNEECESLKGHIKAEKKAKPGHNPIISYGN